MTGLLMPSLWVHTGDPWSVSLFENRFSLSSQQARTHVQVWYEMDRGQLSRIYAKFRSETYLRRKDGIVVCLDALSFLNKLPSGCADMVFLDPPFNLGKRYGSRHKSNDNRDEAEYEDYMHSILDSSSRILKPGGTLYLFHIPRWAMPFGDYLSERLIFRNWIAISLTNGFPPPRRLYPAHYALLFFSKGQLRIFRRPKIPIQTCSHCHKTLKSYGGKLKFMKGKVNLTDVWTDVSPIRHRERKHRVANELPMMILNRIMMMSSTPGGLMVDPFAGTGTSLIAAKNYGMRFLGCDVEREYCRTMKHRIENGGA